MNIAVITKPNMLDHPTRLSVLEILGMDKSISAVECPLGSVIPENTDKILVFGGDGTMLEAVRATRGRAIPILGVNLGYLGFLTSFEQTADCERIVKCLKNGNIVKRMLLNVGVNDYEEILALNEAVIKTAGTRPIVLDVSIDDKYVDTFHSDGIIISSPAGSTAYSLSAGGPVLAPDVDATVIIPICAHSLHSRPLVVNAASKISVKLSGEHDGLVSIDGESFGKLQKNGVLTVKKSLRTAEFLSDGDESFYAKLLKKMNRWGTTSL